MVHPAEVVALAFGSMLRGKLVIGIKEHMVVLRDVPDQTRTESHHLFVTRYVRAVSPAVGDLLEEIAVHADPQMLWHQLVLGSEVRMDGLARLLRVELRRRIVILVIPQ